MIDFVGFRRTASLPQKISPLEAQNIKFTFIGNVCTFLALCQPQFISKFIPNKYMFPFFYLKEKIYSASEIISFLFRPPPTHPPHLDNVYNELLTNRQNIITVCGCSWV